VTKFVAGAWVIIASIPLLVLLLLRLNRQYEREDVELEADAPKAATAPILRRHVVLVLVDRLDLAAARAIQYSRTLMPDELRAVHFITDTLKAEKLAEDWRRLGLSRVTLDLRECADRVIPNAAILAVAEVLAQGDTEVSVLLPNRKYKGLWHRVLHDQTADKISEEVSRLPHANVTLVPFHLGADHGEQKPVVRFAPRAAAFRRLRAVDAPVDAPAERADGTMPIGYVQFRTRARCKGRVNSVRVQPLAGTPTLECTIADETGQITVTFLGRRHIAGIEVGRHLVVEGIAAEHHGRLSFINPYYELLLTPAD